MEMPTESREWQQEILPVLTKYFRFPSSSARFEFLRVSMVQNADRTQKVTLTGVNHTVKASSGKCHVPQDVILLKAKVVKMLLVYIV